MGDFQADFQAELLSPWQQSEHVFPLISPCPTWSTAYHHQELNKEPNLTYLMAFISMIWSNAILR